MLRRAWRWAGRTAAVGLAALAVNDYTRVSLGADLPAPQCHTFALALILLLSGLASVGYLDERADDRTDRVADQLRAELHTLARTAYGAGYQQATTDQPADDSGTVSQIRR